jgi:hypothetical protein
MTHKRRLFQSYAGVSLTQASESKAGCNRKLPFAGARFGQVRPIAEWGLPAALFSKQIGPIADFFAGAVKSVVVECRQLRIARFYAFLLKFVASLPRK